MLFAFRAFTFVVLTAVLIASASLTCAQTVVEPAQADVHATIHVSAAHEESWQLGDTKVFAFKGGRGSDGLAQLRQGTLHLSGKSLVVFDTATAGGHEIRAYAEGQVVYRDNEQWQNKQSHTVRLRSQNSIDTDSASISKGDAQRTPSSLVQRAINRLNPGQQQVTPIGLQVRQDSFTPPQFEQMPAAVTPLSRRIQIRPRSNQQLQIESSQSRDTIPAEQVYVIKGGANVLVDGVAIDIGGQTLRPGVLDLSADRIVIWTEASETGELPLQQDILQTAGKRFQVYLEGNILVRLKDNTITATHAFFDANNDRALLLNAELRAFLPQTGGSVRVRAARLRQLSADRFHAQNGWTTSSPYGRPGYRIQATDIFVEPGPISPFTELDPLSGQPVHGQPMWITALNSQFMVGDTPLLWLPKLSAPAEDPHIPIRQAAVKHDRVFGLQIKMVWDLTKVLGQPKQPGTQWDLLTDYFSKRGPGVGINGEYNVQNNLGQATGNSTIYYQYDDGTDRLGRDRMAIPPDNNSRGEIIGRHKQLLPGNAQLFGEIGYLTDRNYLESFHENRFDTDKDAETILGIRKDSQAWSGSLWGRARLNDIDATTAWLPRADLFGFSQPLFNGFAYWSSHSSVGYADLQKGDPPKDITLDPYTPLGLPYIQAASGLVAMTRHEIDAPFLMGPVNINPFVMGEAATWDEGLNGQQDVGRFVASGGVQAHLAATRIMPFVRSELWNLNGLAHKSDTYLEYRITDSSEDLDNIAQYNEIDDNATERFRGRYPLQIYGGLIPNEFDPRNYAVRNGAGLWASAPYHELVEDQEVLRFRWRNRLQTKVGPAQSQRIRDWMIWESGLSYFPNASRDNFGEHVGLIYSNYRWNINDRTSVLADGIYDLFQNSQENWSVGVLSQRSSRGSLYAGLRQVKAKNYLDSQTVVASYSYQMSPKWISTASYAYDIAVSESRGSSVTVSRVGLDWVLHIGLGIDTSKDNVGIAFSLEPRFGPPSPTNLSYLLGLQR
mgnify:CR=1 FL=1